MISFGSLLKPVVFLGSWVRGYELALANFQTFIQVQIPETGA